MYGYPANFRHFLIYKILYNYIYVLSSVVTFFIINYLFSTYIQHFAII